MTTIAVVGGGAAGLGAARTLLHAGLDVVLLEAAPRLGGNCLAVEVRGADGRRWTVDAGVSDFNRATFGEFARLVDELGLPTHPIGTDASFARADGPMVAACQGGRWRFADGALDRTLPAEIERFRHGATAALADERTGGWTVGAWLDHVGASRALRDLYVLPRAAGCFPMPDRDPAAMPLRGLIEFWRIHGVVGPAPADRRCVTGGMHRYPAAFADWFRAAGGELRCGARVRGVARRRGRVELRTADRGGRPGRLAVDHVLFAVPPAAALAMLDEPAAAETAALRRVPGQRARVVVHRDPRVVADDLGELGAFHYVVPAGGLPRVRPTITFSPNRLAGLPAGAPEVFVTMNPHREPDRDAVVRELAFEHPIAGPRQAAAAAAVAALQGHRRTWFAGSWLAAPFVHESALASGRRAAEQLVAAATATRRATVDLARA